MNKREIILGKDLITNPEQALPFEWLETNGLGAYAMSNVYNCQARKYHGMLVAPIESTGEKILFLSKYLTRVVENKVPFELSVNKYPGAYYPAGYQYIEYFSYENNYPQILYHIGDAKILKSFLMVQEQHTVLLRFDILQSSHKLLFQSHPLLAFRNSHQLHHKNLDVKPYIHKEQGQWFAEPYEGLPKLYFKTNKPTKFFSAPDWYNNLEYHKEQMRGYDYSEDLFTPGLFEASVNTNEYFILQASLHKKTEKPDVLWDREVALRKERKKIFTKGSSQKAEPYHSYNALRENAHKFLISSNRNNLPSITAGFPWFGEWGRDTMISLAGLTLYNKQKDNFLSILKTYTSFERDGLFPNQLNVYGESSYNTIDASLWFFRVIRQYLVFNKNSAASKKEIQTLFGDVIKNILCAFAENRVPHTFLQDDGYLAAGDESTQLTWMDAIVDGQPVTPRHGNPVEINALWYNALLIFEELFSQKGFEGTLARLAGMRNAIETSFESRYFLSEKKYLCDTIIHGQQIDQLRPNQLIALALPSSLVSDECAKLCLESIEHHLFTPAGLRTLNSTNPMYRGMCKGDQKTRDAAYHQGTVWPFLFGIYTDAMLRVHTKNKTKLKQYQKQLLSFVQDTASQHGINSLAEIHEGDLPHRTRGCPFQAWSVAELIRSVEILGEVLT